MITTYKGKNGRMLVAIGPDMGITVSTDSNGGGLLEGPETAMEDLCKAIMAAQERKYMADFPRKKEAEGEPRKQPRTAKEGDRGRIETWPGEEVKKE
jgi:hypothetical protein